MKPGRWVIVGLVAAVLLLAVGFWLGHRSVTTSTADAQAWRDSTAVLLGQARKAHAAEVDSLRDEIRFSDAQMLSIRASDQHARLRAYQSRAAADSLQAVLAEYSEIPIDSLAIYPAIVALQDSTIAAQASALAAQDSALAIAERSRSVLLQVVDQQESRIHVLEGQLTTTPKPERASLRLGRFTVRWCATVHVVRVDRVGTGPAVCT